MLSWEAAKPWCCWALPHQYASSSCIGLPEDLACPPHPPLSYVLSGLTPAQRIKCSLRAPLFVSSCWNNIHNSENKTALFYARGAMPRV